MPKIKTHRGAAKRFKKTGTGKIKRSKAYASHLLGGKSPKRKRNLRKAGLVSEAETRGISRLIPY
ncbi:50S ribosomal protein L35 [Syntrophomonas wolfei]|jgi:large subunit ribosomal protein L35|uniref:Large ribosomal subunit protein bL35 n=2 Tax=Syntrophomonas wolfei TaxID=863 RepID=RL35_SYNWW|nr:50S ribosomal protein L35 [Syntrophomonas wolfei]Q0AY03.1 RecName: Full=Large ribosomal subunit protein bL35; AltName: Full=50S ribosomal protein L35 [Syntrophomonas wolfei subsp. wolfei str. Goettingen G311]ABI68401.1 LSU ribosomal protein L35P [Syntrophomonas wolfei subsp. wolfei str. Goettingen G311]